MQSSLEPFANKQVRIDQRGDKPLLGRLVKVQTDYATVWDGKQLTHVPYAHIKCVSTDITENPVAVPVPVVEFVDTFTELLNTLMMQMVRIENGDGSREGVLSNISEDSISIIVATKELTLYPRGQIQNISPKFTIASGSSSQGPNNQGTDPSSQNTHDNKSGDGSSSQATETRQKASQTNDASRQTTDRSVEQRAKSSQGNPQIFNVGRARTMLERLNTIYNSRQTQRRTSNTKRRSSDSLAVGMTGMPTSYVRKSNRRLQDR